MLTLHSFLQQYANQATDLTTVVEKFVSKKLSKGDHLLKEGQVAKDFVYVSSGCLRLYYIAEDTEVSVWFAFPHSSAIEISSFVSGAPSEYSIQAIEDTEILYLPKTVLEQLYTTIPELQKVMRKFWEDVVLQLIKRFTALQKETAEQRYRDLLLNTDYLQKIPQKYLASFIGVTPTSFSRIKRNIR